MFNKVKQYGKRVALAATGIGAMAAPALAGEWYSGVTLSTTPVTTVAGVVVGALAGTWAIRKVIKLFNRS